VADYTADMAVDQLLSRRRCLLGIRCIVLRREHEPDFLSTDHRTLGIDFIDCHPNPVLVVLADMGARSADGTHVTDSHHVLLGVR
jgi:hypothetical protein